MMVSFPYERNYPSFLMRSAYLTVSADSEAAAERLYGVLSDQGVIFMKTEQTFFANRFAMLRDRFGTSWMLLHQPDATKE